MRIRVWNTLTFFPFFFLMFLELQLGGFFSNRGEKKREAVKEGKKERECLQANLKWVKTDS